MGSKNFRGRYLYASKVQDKMLVALSLGTLWKLCEPFRGGFVIDVKYLFLGKKRGRFDTRLLSYEYY